MKEITLLPIAEAITSENNYGSIKVGELGNAWHVKAGLMRRRESPKKFHFLLSTV